MSELEVSLFIMENKIASLPKPQCLPLSLPLLSSPLMVNISVTPLSPAPISLPRDNHCCTVFKDPSRGICVYT